MEKIFKLFNEAKTVLGNKVKEVTVEAEWTGNFPNLCRGTWYLTVNGMDCSKFIPEPHMPMNTEKDYASWSFDDNWSEVWEYEKGGLPFEKWRRKNKWLEQISMNISVQKLIYKAINPEDWCHGCCGGCI